MESHQQVNQDSGCVEWYTPVEIIEAVRECLGEIDLDPASCEKANKVVKAKKIYTINDSGLNHDWHGRVWLNHPFGEGEKACKKYKTKPGYQCKKDACKKRGYHIDEDVPGNKEWIDHLMEQYLCGNIEEAITICFNSTSEDWFQPLLGSLQCFVKGRVNYINQEGEVVKGNPKGSVITYLGEDSSKFIDIFEKFGVVK